MAGSFGSRDNGGPIPHVFNPDFAAVFSGNSESQVRSGRIETELRRADGECPLLAQSRHSLLHCTCPLLGVKQTWPFAGLRFRGRYSQGIPVTPAGQLSAYLRRISRILLD